jgi:thiosulfate reductase cytochrome b subunit
MLGWLLFLGSAAWRFLWAFLGDGPATHGSHEIVEDRHHFSFRRGDLKLAGRWVTAYLTFQRDLPTSGEYNPLQRFVYSIAFPLVVIASALTGFALWPATQSVFAGLTGFLGGEEAVRQAHYAIMIATIVLTALHLYAAAFAGFWRVAAMLLRWAPARDRAQ